MTFAFFVALSLDIVSEIMIQRIYSNTSAWRLRQCSKSTSCWFPKPSQFFLNIARPKSPWNVTFYSNVALARTYLYLIDVNNIRLRVFSMSSLCLSLFCRLLNRGFPGKRKCLMLKSLSLAAGADVLTLMMMAS